MSGLRKLDVLIKNLEGCLSLNNFTSPKQTFKISQNLKGKFNIGKLNSIIVKKVPLTACEDRELYYLSKEFSSLLEDQIFTKKLKINAEELRNDLDINKYFTEIQIKGFETYVEIEEKLEDRDILVIENVTEVAENYYSATIIIDTMLDIFNEGKIYYDYNCQREPEKIEWKGRFVEIPKVYNKSISQMAELIGRGEYDPTAIAINVVQTGEESFYFEEYPTNEFNQFSTFKRGKIIIKFNKETAVNLIDGYHRLIACSVARQQAKSKGERFFQPMNIIVMNRTNGEARKYIYQEGQKNAIDPTWLNSMKKSIENELAQYFNKGNHSLSGKLGREDREIKMLGKLTTFEIFAEGLKQFELDENDAIKIRRIKRYIKLFFDYVLSFNKELLKHTDKRAENLALHKNMFYFYLYLAKKLYGRDEWEDTLIDCLESVDYSQQGKLKDVAKLNLSNISLKRNKNNVIDIEKYFDNLLSKFK